MALGLGALVARLCSHAPLMLGLGALGGSGRGGVRWSSWAAYFVLMCSTYEKDVLQVHAFFAHEMRTKTAVFVPALL